MTLKRNVIANHIFITISSVVYQNGAVMNPDEAIVVLLHEPTKRQDGWAFLQEKNPR